LNWIRAFSLLGHEVYYVEDDTVWPFDPELNSVTDRCDYAVRHIFNCLRAIGLEERWAFRLADRPNACWGLTSAKLDELYRSCDILLNLSGGTSLRDVQMLAPLRVYLQTDPVTSELRLAGGDDFSRAEFNKHDLILSYGENYGAEDCLVPLNGLASKYRRTRQPIDLDLWPMAFSPAAQNFTTIGNYRQTGADVSFNGEIYHWSKHHEWEKFITLPSCTTQSFHLAMQVEDPLDKRKLEENGWLVSSPLAMSLDVFGAYPEFFRGSRAEFTVAKDQNVRLRSGWFSDRDACYLATGKPVIAQDTGFSNLFTTGKGLFAFTTMDEVLEAICAINSDYETHCRATREIALEFFEARKVGSAFLESTGAL
jgi:hypothetical protein